MPKSSKVLNMCYRSWNCLMSQISSEEYWFTCCCWSIRSRWYVSVILPNNFSSEFENLEEITISHPVWKTKMTIWHLILVINMKDTENLAFCIVNLFFILFYICFYYQPRDLSLCNCAIEISCRILKGMQWNRVQKNGDMTILFPSFMQNFFEMM